MIRATKRIPTLRTALLLVAGAGSVGIPSVASGQTATFPSAPWTDLPATVVSETSYRSGFGTGLAASGATVELRPGSPFVRVGDEVFQLANAPFLAGGRLHVPTELLAHPAFELPDASVAPSSDPSGSGSIAAGPVVAGETTRRPGPWRVVIDPGHGGRDPGTSSPRTGARERDIALSVSKRIHDELASHENIDPWLTRSTDVFIEVPDRPRLAVEREGDLFVSIHVDAQRPPATSARGFTTYYLGPARTEQGRLAAMRENTVAGAEPGSGPNIDQLEFILAGLDQSTHLTESVRFGGYIQNRLRDVVDSPDRGVRAGPYWVLVRATSNMPTVLVELGFITNAREERRLTDPAHQAEMAGAIAAAIREYLDDKAERLERLGSR